MKVWKRLSTYHALTNKERIKPIKRDLSDCVMQCWRQTFFVTWKALALQKLLPAAEYGREYGGSYFWAGSVAKAMTSQRCFHREERREGWFNSPGLIQTSVYTKYLLGLARNPLMLSGSEGLCLQTQNGGLGNTTCSFTKTLNLTRGLFWWHLLENPGNNLCTHI